MGTIEYYDGSSTSTTNVEATTVTSTGYYPTCYYYEKEEYIEEDDRWLWYNWAIDFLLIILLMSFLVECRCRSPGF